MLKRIHRHFSNLSLKYKVFGILLAAMLTLSAIFTFSLNWVDQIYRNHLYQSVAERLAYAGEEISDKLQAVETMSQMMLSRSIMQDGLFTIKNSQDSRERSAANEALRTAATSYASSFGEKDVSYINLYCGDYKTGSNPYASSLIPDSIHQSIRAAARAGEGAPVWVVDHATTYGLFLGRQVRQVKSLALTPLGELVVNVDLEKMIAESSVFNGYSTYGYLLLGDEDVVYYSPSLSYADAQYVQNTFSGNYEIIDIGGLKYFSVRRTLPFYDWDYVCLLEYDQLLQELHDLRTRIIAYLTLGALAILGVAFLMLDSITRHFKLLADRMLALGEDSTSLPPVPYDYSQRKDEAGILHQQFEEMVMRLDHLIQINYINELMKKEAQLQALENQINPHFLYNTLESVNWRARLLGATDISEMVQALASLLRVTLNQNSNAYTLGQELGLIKSYMTIQQYRFDDRLQYTVEAPAELYDLTIPKLILQPLVENAIRYGLEDNIEACEIRIAAARQGDRLCLRVSNTGSAFEEDLMTRLKQQAVQPHGHGIALCNIEERLRLTYGEAGRLRLYNQEDWAVAELLLPAANTTEGTTVC